MGYFKDNFAYSTLVEDYLRVTGLDIPEFIGQPTPLLPSTWNIADSQLRWTSDIFFTVGRIGLPLLVSLIVSISNNSYEIFNEVIISLGILGSLLSTYLSLKIFETSFRLLMNYNFDCFNNFNKLLILIIGSLSNWLIIYVTEGTIIQLYILIALQFALFNLLSYLFYDEAIKFSKLKRILQLSSAPIFISVVYPHGFLGLIFITFPILLNIFYLSYIKKDNTYFIIALFSIFTFAPFTLFLLNGLSLTVPLKMFIDGVAGMSYNLGNASIFDYFYGVNYSLLPSNISGNGTGFILENQSLLNMRLSSLALLFISIVLPIIFLILTKKNKINTLLLFGINFVLVLVIVKAIFLNNFQSYIYSRNCVNYVVIGMPILFAFVFSLYFSIVKNKYIHKLISYFSQLLIILLLISNVYQFSHFSSLFIKNSKKFNIISDFSEIKNFDLKNSILVSDKPLHEVFSLCLVTPVFYITDDWSPVIKSEYFMEHNIKVFKIIIVNNKINFEHIGYISLLNNSLHGPLNVEQLINNKGFINIK